MGRSLRLVAVAAMLTVVCSSCYLVEVDALIDSDATEKPWYCNPIAPNSVTGPGMGSVDFYAGETREPLSWDECRTLAIQMDVAKGYAMKYPTLGDLEAAGGRTSFTFLPGMGTHSAFQTVTPELLADPDFDPHNPVWEGPIDDVFHAQEPEFLQYNGNGPDAELVGMSWYVRTDDGQPPEGFVGDNDWWHHHPRLCFRSTDAIIIGVNQNDSTCANNGGVNLHTQNYYMVHLWVVDDLEYEADVFAPQHPCITSGGAIFDMDDPCHTSLLPNGAASRSGDAPVPASAYYCPLARLADT